VKDYNLHNLRSQLSYVPQEIFLFSDTIANNVAIDAEVAHKDADGIKQAAHLAAVDKDIEGISDQYQTMTGERGVMLSVGQKQRKAITIAIYQNKNRLTTPHSSSAVDTKTEPPTNKNHEINMNHVTTIIITFREINPLDFDVIVVLDKGTIIEQGTPDHLKAL